MAIRSILKPSESVVASIAAVGIVYATYQLDVGPVSQAHATPANHPALETSRKKAGYTAFILVSALAAITRDANIAVLGYGSVIAMEIHYRHAIMSDPQTGTVQPPADSEYQDAQNVIPLTSQGVAVGY